MVGSDLPESQLLKTLLEPLLDDFQYWFERSHTLLNEQPLEGLSAQEQATLLARVQQARQEVASAKALFQATGGQVGIESSALMPWHHLVMECWKVSVQHRLGSSSTRPDSPQ
ncbi:MAG: DUF2605 domain-containing protein [Kaiparowitsia implicata GSE-PSE-MK54-09C]|jgi:hypothetical protein|nr:DUF2605 domain-containing protein [Kaiparowitsia implicata GSE-PSE-MK54-09C]